MKSFLTGIVLFTALAAGAAEIKHPSTGARLLHKATVAPAMTVLVGDTLYYTEWIGDTACKGADLYAHPLAKKQESRLATIPCVNRVMADNNKVFAESQVEGGTSQLYAWHDAQLTPIFDKHLEDLLAARIQFHLFERGTHGAVAFGPRMMRVKDGKVYSLQLLKVDGKWQHLLEVIQLVGDKTRLGAAPIELTLEAPVRDFDIDGKGHLYALIQEHERSKIAVIEITGSTSHVISELGNNPHAGGVWESVKETDWAIRMPLFLTATDFGFTIFDKTPRINEARIVSLYHAESREFTRFRIPSTSITGITATTSGFLVTRGLDRDVTWYGETNPFPIEQVPATDVFNLK